MLIDALQHLRVVVRREHSFAGPHRQPSNKVSEPHHGAALSRSAPLQMEHQPANWSNYTGPRTQSVPRRHSQSAIPPVRSFRAAWRAVGLRGPARPIVVVGPMERSW